MSLAGELWEASAVKKYGSGAGHAHPSVQYFTCPVCAAPPGKLCIGADGSPHLDRHYKRAYLWSNRRAPKLLPRAHTYTLNAIIGDQLFRCGFRGCQRTAHHVLVTGSRGRREWQLFCCSICWSEFRNGM